jgi:hypothetical protein
VEQALLTHPEHLSSPSVFSGVYVTQSLIFCVVFCRLLFVLLYFFFWPLCCLFFDLQLLITPQVSYFRTTYKLVHVLLNQIDLDMIHLLNLSLTKIVIQVGLIKSCNEMHAIIPPTHPCILIKFWANKTLVINNHMFKSIIKH